MFYMNKKKNMSQRKIAASDVMNQIFCNVNVHYLLIKVECLQENILQKKNLTFQPFYRYFVYSTIFDNIQEKMHLMNVFKIHF